MSGVDSERWDCRSCGGTFIGQRPADDICRGCVVTQVTTEPAASIARVDALTGRQRRDALIFLAGYTPKGFDLAVAAVTEMDETEARAREAGETRG